MTHSNHRRGSRESLVQDWVVFCFPSIDNPEGLPDPGARIPAGACFVIRRQRYLAAATCLSPDLAGVCTRLMA